MRFRPPARDLPEALGWLLSWAFGPLPGTWRTPPARPDEALDLARRLGIAPRLVTRAGLARLRTELGAAVAEELAKDRGLALAQELRLSEALASVLAMARGRGIRALPLKGMALVERGFSASGSRAMADVDVLVDEEHVETLQAALLAAGFTDPEGRSYEHQAPMLRAPSGVALELHRSVPGVRIAAGGAPNGRFARRSEFEAAGKPALAAHAMVHALAQHGFTPALGGLTWIGDLVDLGCADAEEFTAARPWVSGALAKEEVDAALDLVRILAGGELGALAGPSAARQLLRHFVWGSIDSDYRDSLRLRSFERPLSEQPEKARLAAVWSTLFPPRQRSTVTGIETWRAYSRRLLRRPGYLWRRWLEARRGATTSRPGPGPDD